MLSKNMHNESHSPDAYERHICTQLFKVAQLF